ncbi:GNAT family N-acetyltransferase [Phenylobacterium sp. SCN 70-31]|uniref:GNAT family N-acetyltransferase n=1 Tax=Phenylobacterium sp. SCN 70-31 TaxID=1660129 RepID=UPI00086F8944|nr:GNAT family N-acetyltransferase [Phenylobacterium sp. SCN 70-31]ODT88676.1 MAG: GNAT family N-acetyltransferase [Phenylobacterium sp. SCN 70-31]
MAHPNPNPAPAARPAASGAVIRRAGETDAPLLATLGARTFRETFAHLYPPEDLAAFLAQAYDPGRTRLDLIDPAQAAWIMEQGGEAIGYAQAGPCGLPHPEVTSACGELKRIYFLKGAQGSGLGGRLFAEVMEWLQSAGPRTVWIGVWSENFGARRFYERQGFHKVGEYGFHVGATVDLEFILRRPAESFARPGAQTERDRHNPA